MLAGYYLTPPFFSNKMAPVSTSTTIPASAFNSTVGQVAAILLMLKKRTKKQKERSKTILPLLLPCFSFILAKIPLFPFRFHYKNFCPYSSLLKPETLFYACYFVLAILCLLFLFSLHSFSKSNLAPRVFSKKLFHTFSWWGWKLRALEASIGAVEGCSSFRPLSKFANLLSPFSSRYCFSSCS